MAKSAKSATVNPFASAAANAKKPGETKKDRPIFVPSDFYGENGSLVFSAQTISESIVSYSDGNALMEQGKAMKDAASPVIEGWTEHKFCEEWIKKGTRPENPALMSAPTGGTTLKFIYMDSMKKLDDAQFAHLAQVIGTDAAESNVVRRHEFTINSDVLDQDTSVNQNGKVVKMNVMEALTEALQEKFGPSPDILAALFIATEKFHTQKGLIDKGLQLVQPNPYRLAEFLQAIRATTQIKTGASSNE